MKLKPWGEGEGGGEREGGREEGGGRFSNINKSNEAGFWFWGFVLV